MLKCLHAGCQQDFDEQTNTENSCQYHPGKPVFHEGMKSWSCCKKNRLTFEEFMSEPGCTTGFHSDKKPQDEASPALTASNNSNEPKNTNHTAQEIKEATSDSKIEHFTSTFNPSLYEKPIVPDSTQKNEPAPEPTFEDDPEDLTVAEGTVCKRKSCGYRFLDSSSPSFDSNAAATCTFHSGAPVFHEGSKGWSCCKRRVLEFDEFLKIRGCKTGKHMFSEPISKKMNVTPKTDFYQTQSCVMFYIFAKKINKDASTAKVNSNSISVDLLFEGDNRYTDEIMLFGDVDALASSYKILSTKIEFELKKANGISWPSLGPTSSIKSWTTFGKGDSPLPKIAKD